MPRVDGTTSVSLSPPSAGTLRKYRLTVDHWLAICRRQGWKCPICNEPFGDRKLAIDHAHVKRFKKLKPKQRRLHVRGVLHSHCNRYVRGWLTLTRARAVVAYLETHEARKCQP